MGKRITYGAAVAIFLFCGTLSAQQEKARPETRKSTVQPGGSAAQKAADNKEPQTPVAVFGFQDRDRDGKNDLFRDADGDGINDITKKPYPHKFKFADEDEDKINDLFVDADGDGVNDLEVKFIDADSDGINDNIIDVDKNHINDITGLRYTSKSLRGYKYGFIKEERLLMMRGFIDEDGDGIADAPRGMMLRKGMRDRIIDRDGDGIDDRREMMRKFRPGPRR
ncbi:MAG: hypothetical protein JXQ83_06770 [Candidatus Glassbacteria bacterium]|nr:hypothetical protein [Candidatus Glassbacteria bacterium]